MKRTELILLSIWIGFFALHTIDYPGRTTLMFLAAIFLGIFYAFRTPKYFSGKSTGSLILSACCGISFGIALFTIPLRAALYSQDWIKFLQIPIIILTIILVAKIILDFIKKYKIQSYIKQLLSRSLLIGLLSSFFAFSTLESSAFRAIIYPLHHGNDKLQSNILMFHFHDEASEYLRNRECEKAEKSAIRSLQEGLKWISLINKEIPQDQKLSWIRGTIENTYKAFRCLAKGSFDDKNYEKALNYGLKADSVLNLNPIETNDEWKRERADSKNKIGIYYERLNQNDSAATYYTKAIIYYSDSVGIKDKHLATYFYNLGHVLGEAGFFEKSNQLLQSSIEILKLDTLNQDSKEEISQTYLKLAYNGLASNKLELTRASLENSYQNLTARQFCEYNLYSSIYSIKQDDFKTALDYANKALACYTTELGESNQNVAASNMTLHEVWMNIPNYDSAFASIQRGKEITKTNYGSQSVSFHDYEKREAYYLYVIGNYDESLSSLLNVEKLYRRYLGKDSEKLPEVLAIIGRIKTEQGAIEEAIKYATESLRLAESLKFFIDNNAVSLLNNIAYINYAAHQNFVADTLFRKSIELNIEANKDSSLSVANALNGLGLLAIRELRFSEADSLFNQSLKLYNHLIPELHPDIGIVLINKSELSFKRKNFKDALELTDQALESFTSFHRPNHPTIGDMYSLKASILIQRDERITAKILLEKALKIYESNFQPEHIKVKETKNRLMIVTNSH